MPDHIVLIPERYRLGDTLSYKVRRVPSIQCNRLTVCCPPSWRFLYPSASDFVDVEETLDGYGERKVIKELQSRWSAAEFVKIGHQFKPVDIDIQPPITWPQAVDVAIAPRKKDSSSPHRNWSGWQQLTRSLVADGLVVEALGRKDQSFDCAIRLTERLDCMSAIIERAKLVVATDSAVAHLAILLKRPLVVLWGKPVGVIPCQSYTQGCHARMESQKRSEVFHVENAWIDIDHAIAEVRRIFACLK
ncbi:glycosyltransferase family 9 protein [Prosthecobacter sp.]|uniref:glycosyltransferase family 9 protein n=1 Tax=Prosthecobacter sp. TaxID=1965333 RepID=UPI002488FBBF|nr:glycosyltransferase family 9 protein [Prosthecobacter sp.]MDI1314809.1 glycosyltransferase family 9 protein [Prosthecobacter sp.]